jgi:hypothetical protein
MFVSLPQHQVLVPEGLAMHPRARYWRSVSLSMYCAWYVVTFRPATKADRYFTCLLSWDSDVAETIEQFGTDVSSVLCITPPRSEADDAWRCTTMREVWRGVDPRGDSPCVIFVDDAGVQYSGVFCSRSEAIVRQQLVARIDSAQAAAH